MKKSVRLLQLILLAGSVFLLLGSVTYAWFSKLSNTDVLEIHSASLKVEAKLYQAGNSLNTPLDEDYEEIVGSIEFSEGIPGQVYYFKLEVTNTGSIDGILTVKLPKDKFEYSIVKLFTIITGDDENVLVIDDEYEEYILFENEEIAPNATKTLYFQITIEGNIELSTINNLKIDQISIRLDQKQE